MDQQKGRFPFIQGDAQQEVGTLEPGPGTYRMRVDGSGQVWIARLGIRMAGCGPTGRRGEGGANACMKS